MKLLMLIALTFIIISGYAADKDQESSQVFKENFSPLVMTFDNTQNEFDLSDKTALDAKRAALRPGNTTKHMDSPFPTAETGYLIPETTSSTSASSLSNSHSSMPTILDPSPDVMPIHQNATGIFVLLEEIPYAEVTKEDDKKTPIEKKHE